MSALPSRAHIPRLADFLRCSSSSRLLENNRAFLHIGKSRGLARHRLPFYPMVYLEPAVARARWTRPFAMVSLMPHRRRRVFVDTPKGRHSAGFTVPESADAADVSMALRRRGWSPYALRLDSEQHAWIALVMNWRRAA